MKKDKMFKRRHNLREFNFGKETVAVFDNMLNRSVPFYNELQRMIAEIANEFAQDGTNIYDLGCSTGTTLMNLYSNVTKDVKLVGVDYSKDMLSRCRQRLLSGRRKINCRLMHADLNQFANIKNASVVILNLTLQFIRPLYRDRLIASIRNGLIDNGCLILIEKVLGNNSNFNRTFIKFYYDFKKRQGYSDLEIANKRDALENVLIPYHSDENKQLLKKNGFSQIDIFFKWYNFCGIVAIK